ncbi:hypothetical protein H9655_02730 [Cytobacillus sp. Sa5YUA1]|uniref:Uncharacterized protein n=1 Tax=Cytobacillus stercorigallinarum TaxID=2762240 RepID=A0ABR8QKP8_9BACI|nr:hypothetical protein [Cytobacillus stercorigallinarum]
MNEERCVELLNEISNRFDSMFAEIKNDVQDIKESVDRIEANYGVVSELLKLKR